MTEEQKKKASAHPRLRRLVWRAGLILLLGLFGFLWSLGGEDLPGEEHMRRAKIYLEEEDYRSARGEYIEAVIAFQRVRETRSFAEACLELGRVDLRIGDGIHAREFLEDAAASFAALGDKAREEEAQRLLDQAQEMIKEKQTNESLRSPLLGLFLVLLLLLFLSVPCFYLIIINKKRREKNIR